MSKFNVVVGDWSGDGHEKTDTYTVSIPDRFTPEILGENYRKNVKVLGIDPTTFARGYEDAEIPADVLKTLNAYGVEYNDEIEDGEEYLSSEGMLNVIMFLFGLNLVGFSWELGPSYPLLAGGFGAIGPTSIGYGLV